MRLLRHLALAAVLLLLVPGLAAANQFITPPITVTNTATSGLNISGGSGLGMAISVEVSAIGAGDTWTFKGQLLTAAGNAVDITATSANVTAASTVFLPLVAPYNYSTSTPFPTQIVATRVASGGAPTVTYRIIGTFSGSGPTGALVNYLFFNSTSSCWNFFGAAGLEWQFCPNYAVPPPCGSEGLANAPGGAECWDAANGRRRFKDGRGEWSQ